MKKLTVFIFVFYCITFVPGAFAQQVKLSHDSAVGYLNKVSIDSEKGNFSSFPDSNIRTYFSHKNFNGSISEDGNVFISHKKVIKTKGTQYEEIEIPHSDRFDFRCPTIDQTGRYVSYTIQSGTKASVLYFDVDKRENAARYDHVRINESRRMGHFSMSANGNTFAFSILEGGREPSGHYVFIGERKMSDAAFELIQGASQIAVVPGLTSKLFLSQSGDRLIYQGKSGYFSKSPILVYVVDKTKKGWSKPRELSFPEIEIASGLPKIKLFDIANNGRTVLMSYGEKGLAVIHDIGEQWTEPEYLDFKTSYTDDAQISEDGKTVAVHAARTPISNEYTIDFDIFLLMQDAKQEWKKEKVNPDGTDPYGDILLTKNGKTLLWVPKNKG